jgi:xylulokinase
MKAELLLGFDVGTSAVKAGVFGFDGTTAGVASCAVGLQEPRPGICEVDPRAYWHGLRACCRALAEQGVDLRRICALSVAAHAETLIPLDERLRPLRPAIVWVDTRSRQEAVDLADRFGVDQLAAISGQPRMIPMWPATKLLWLRRHEPELVGRVRYWLQPLDYLVARLTGQVASDSSEYSSSLLLDIRARTWWQPMLDELDLERRKLPELLPAAMSVGRLTPVAAGELGLSGATAVVMGGFDQACTAVGAGNVREGVISESTGTSLAVITTIRQPPRANSSVPCHVHVVPDLYFLCAHNPTGGSAYAWVRDELAPELSLPQLDGLAASVEEGCEGLVLLPTMSGTATPTFDPLARGVLFGLTLRHRRAHLARAALEGVALMLAQLVEESRRLGAAPQELRSVGGGARSALWSQIKADVSALPVSVPVAADHAGALGAAVVAGAGAGIFPSIEAGADALVRVERTFEPNPAASERYRQARSVQAQLYPRLAELFHLESA